jgi:hypothetical protein
MKYAGEQVRKWLLAELAGIEIDGITLPVYNLADMNSEAPYILIVNQTQSNVLTKDARSAEVTALVQCVTKFDGDYGGDMFADRMASEVSEIITDATGQTDDFIIQMLALDANETVNIINQTERVIVRQLAYRFIVSQSKNKS